MVDIPSERQLEMQENVAREEATSRHAIAVIQVAAGTVLIASTLFAWMNHPIFVRREGNSPAFFVREVSHTIGLATVPAGFFALGIGLLAVVVALGLRGGRPTFGWSALAIAAGAVGVSAGEIVQLLLGRRNWLDDHPIAHAHATSTPLVNAIGAGVWIAAGASLVLVASALTYLWLAHSQWKVGVPLVPRRTAILDYGK